MRVGGVIMDTGGEQCGSASAPSGLPGDVSRPGSATGLLGGFGLVVSERSPAAGGEAP